jgi:hypothetical protein
MNRLFLLLFGAMSLVTHAQVPDYVPTEGLVAWYPFNGNANDESGNGNDGAVIGGVSTTTDRFGNSNSAYFFNGSDGYISISSLDNLPYTPITYSAWVIVSSYFPDSFINKFKTIMGRNTAFVLENGAIGFWADNSYGGGAYNNTFLMWRGGGVSGTIPNSDSVPNLNTWLHVAYTQEANGDWKWFHNGTMTNSGNFTDTQNDFNYFQIGGCNNNSQGSNYWDNKLDDIGIWNRALTECEIAALYAAESSTTVSVSAGADLSICSGDSIVLSASGGDSTYTWSNGIEDGVAFVPDSSSYFTVEGSLGACTSTDTVFVEVLQLSTGMDTQVVCDSLTWIDGITYTASTNEPFIALTNAAGCDSIVTLDLTVNYTTYNMIDTTVVNVLEYNGEEYTEGGEYLVYLENEAGCDSIITLKLTVEYVGVDDLETQGNWSVYPNPIESQLTISSANALEFYQVQIFNALGQVIWSEQVSNQVTIEVYGWPRGMYVVELRDEAVSTRERIPILVK